MIKIFRHIRKRLLTEGKTTQYLKYAFGEIILVVLGILIALQINNWNEQRKSNNLLTTYEVNLINELEEDIVQLEEADSLLDVRFESIVNYVRYSHSESPDSTILAQKLDSIQLVFVIFNSNAFSLQDILTSGNLQLFSLERKRQFLNHKLILDKYNNFQELGMELAKFKYNEFESSIDKLNLMTIAPEDSTFSYEWHYNVNTEQSRKLNNYIITFLEYFQSQKAALENLKVHTEELKRELESQV